MHFMQISRDSTGGGQFGQNSNTCASRAGVSAADGGDHDRLCTRVHPLLTLTFTIAPVFVNGPFKWSQVCAEQKRLSQVAPDVWRQTTASSSTVRALLRRSACTGQAPARHDEQQSLGFCVRSIADYRLTRAALSVRSE